MKAELDVEVNNLFGSCCLGDNSLGYIYSL